jgi:pyruvate dehydrogenase E1 component alpha subunit
MSKATQSVDCDFASVDVKALLKELGKERLLDTLKRMLLIRNFEARSEAAYQQGKVGGFFHSYAGQEAIQTAIIDALGADHWYTTTYRCHALALLLGASPEELMAELYGRENGNAKGRGGSMHMFTDRLLGGHGIVGGQIPIATGAGFTLKYKDDKEHVSICFIGDGAVAQGSFHESLNIASLWSLPCIYVIENNQWGMGTAVNRAICVDRLAKDRAPAYNMKGYSIDGNKYFNCYQGFKEIGEEVLSQQRPVLVEVITERFTGHSISDPALYRDKEEMKEKMDIGPIKNLKKILIENGFLDEESYKALDKSAKEQVIEAMKYADASPWPDPITLEDEVYAP